MKPSIPKGTRDFLPQQALKRQYLFDALRSLFQLYGYAPIETPAMENLETLTGKYGEEGDRLIFKILERGDKFANAILKVVQNSNSLQKDGAELNPLISDFYLKELSTQALRYDLTVPFARMVVQYQNEINFPFKRYQIQPVWRADRPQKGRYREFYQCDIDVIGSKSLLNEIELIQMIDEGFVKLGLPDVTLKINNRKVLFGFAEYFGVSDKFVQFTTAIDKIVKIGIQGVINELKLHDIDLSAGNENIDANALSYFFGETTTLERIKSYFQSVSTIGLEGIDELIFIRDSIKGFNLKINLQYSFNLARGLNYYTGCIFEVVHNDFPSSLCGGGRYDDLTGIFGLKDVSGVGVSFGADRIYDLMEQKNLFPQSIQTASKIFFVNFGEQEAAYCLQIMRELRQNGVPCELYPDQAKMKKQMNYANVKNIPFVALVGESELKSKLITIKNMTSGQQETKDYKMFVSEFSHGNTPS